MAPGISMDRRTPITLSSGVTDPAGSARIAVLRAPAIASPFQKGAGCACCAPNGGLTRDLRALLARARRGDIDRVVIETVGDPAHIEAALRGDPALDAVFRLDMAGASF